MPDKKILIIDDEPDVGDILKDFLDDLGYDTHFAADASKGLKIAEEQKPDLVFLDVLMPEISGIECLQKIQAASPDTIVLIMSGMQDEQIAKEAIRLGAYDYITKPFDLDYVENSLLARIFAS